MLVMAGRAALAVRKREREIPRQGLEAGVRERERERREREISSPGAGGGGVGGGLAHRPQAQEDAGPPPNKPIYSQYM